VLRIVVPDLGIRVRDYLADTAKHPGAHHRQMFDARSLVHMLQGAGFPAPEVRTFSSSRISEIAEIELACRRSESLYVEATK
jgi:predicted SAM-dependent methyltransferase